MKWCRHIKWVNWTPGDKGWSLQTRATIGYWVGRNWRCCPVCGAKRPRKRRKD